MNCLGIKGFCSSKASLARTFKYAALALLVLPGCGAVFPEVQTPIRALPTQVEASDIKPPENLYLIQFEKAVIPAKDRAGNKWGGNGPSSFARLMIDDRMSYETPVQSESREPTWPRQKPKSMVIEPGRALRIELWAKKPVQNIPLCQVRVLNLETLRDGGRNVYQCDSGARIWLGVSVPKPAFGLGFYYELRGHDGVKVTRVFANSPAGRAGLLKGDRVLTVMGQAVAQLDGLEVKSLVNKNARTGLDLSVVTDRESQRLIHLDEGPIYAMPDDDFPAQLLQSAQ